MPFDLNVSFLEAAELEIGASLPPSFRSSILQENGGVIETDGDEWQRYPIADTSDRKRLSRTANHIIKETQSCRSWPSFPVSAWAIAGNGSGDQLVFLQQGNSFEPSVYIWSHESGLLLKVADDFSELNAP